MNNNKQVPFQSKTQNGRYSSQNQPQLKSNYTHTTLGHLLLYLQFLFFYAKHVVSNQLSQFSLFMTHLLLIKKEKKQEEDISETESKPIEKPVILYEDKYREAWEKMSPDTGKDLDLCLLKNQQIIEYTPFGNVLMYWDQKNESFIYHSDNNIPYKYLETVARKYSLITHCKSIFIDMKEELRLSEEKMIKRKQQEEMKKKQDEEEKQKQNAFLVQSLTTNNQQQITHTPLSLSTTVTPAPGGTTTNPKKHFAQFKSYNKETIHSIAPTGVGSSGSSSSSSFSSSTPSISSNIKPVQKVANPNANKGNMRIKDDKEYIVKENANRYAREGKITTFAFLKKPPKQIIQKHHGMSYADFKKLATKQN